MDIMRNIVLKHSIAGLLLMAALSGLTQTAAAQTKGDAKPALEIKVKIADYPDSMQNVLLLGRYYGSSQYIIDTAVYNAKTNTYTFSSEQPKERGLYLLITNDKRFAEFILDEDQQFEIETKFPSLNEHIKFTGSPENQLYMDFIEAGKGDYSAMNEAQKAFSEAKESNDTVAQAAWREKITALFDRMDQQKADFIKKNPDHLMAAVFKAQQDIDVPDAPEDTPDSLKREWQYEYYKEHYFDNLDLCDDRLVYTPVFHQRMTAWLDKVLYMQSPDTMKYAIERFIEKCRCSKELFKYAIWYPVDKYQRSEIIGQDAIWVHIAKKYYLTGEAYWATPSIVENFKKRITRVEPLLIGNRPPEFACPDTTVDSPNENFISVFSSPKRYTVVIFWSMTCGHCKKSLPKWLDFYHEKGKELDLEIIAICKDFEVADWKNYIREHHFDWINLNGKTATADYNDLWDIVSTPTVYILDRDKRIVTKRIDQEYAEDFIRLWEREHFEK